MTVFNPWQAAKTTAAFWAVQQNSFFLYHRNSYANNKQMLKSPKPLVMRDMFLTKNDAMLANPLGFLYVQDLPAMFANCTAAGVYGLSLVPHLGVKFVIGTWIAGAWVSGQSYLFQCAVNPKRLDTKYDVTATSAGGFAAVGAMSLFCVKARIPGIHTPLHYFAFPHLIWCLAQEYALPYCDPKKAKGMPYLGNEGCIGGIFFGLVMGTMFVKRRADATAVAKF
eukprot:CAMPEP_0174842008 /NCGR_PEP_ID=MMETSP1114-20130205/9658_1 /TAXON_ID=312471 /ORGANISM="Neobodo designis, Strain CCAP 1951/1" /LENGTH=223 /DNA_ID=CAMNT_0016076205 /DNA_START=43 /DNA_END=711 /DNA_ORIENTATION=-